MPAWVVWLIAAGVLSIGEAATAGVFLGPVAVAALCAAIVAGAGGGTAAQFAVFVVVSALSLLFLRPAVLRRLHRGPTLRTGAAALIGEPAVALARVDCDGGRVKIGGEE